MEAVSQVAEATISPIPVAVHSLTIRPCVFKRGYLIPTGESRTLMLDEAMQKLAPTRSRNARVNVVRARTGQYIGIKPKDRSNFLIVNPTTDGDIRWLIQQNPAIKSELKEVYLVEGVVIRRETVDLPISSGE